MNIHLETGSVSDHGELNELDVLRDKWLEACGIAVGIDLGLGGDAESITQGADEEIGNCLVMNLMTEV